MRATVRIASIAAGGAGVGRVDGMAVFVPRTAPLDFAEVEIVPRKRFGEGTLIHLLEASPHRVTPRCLHYVADQCGGCQLQHLEYTAQCEAKRDIVVQAFRRLARREVAVPPVVPSPQRWHYRNKIVLTARATGGRWCIGLRRLQSPDAVFEVLRCDIIVPSLGAAIAEVRAASTWLPTAPELRLTFREVGGATALTIAGGARWQDHARLAAACPSIASVAWVDAREVATQVHGRAPVGARAFAQVNPGVASLLRQAVAELAGRGNPRTVIDAYCGSGATTALLLAPERSVVGLELDPDAVAAFQSTVGSAARVRAGRVEDTMPLALPADVVVLNPPRTGVAESVTRTLQGQAGPARVVYVSCDPATLARDVARMPAYRVGDVRAFDMFPQTAHVETVCELVREES